MKSIICFVFILIIFSTVSIAANLRGRIDMVNQYSSSPFPARGVQVQIFIMTPMGQNLIYTYYTGGDGMYYIPNIFPGNYTLVVNGVLSFPIQIFNTQLQDIPPILLRY